MKRSMLKQHRNNSNSLPKLGKFPSLARRNNPHRQLHQSIGNQATKRLIQADGDQYKVTDNSSAQIRGEDVGARDHRATAVHTQSDDPYKLLSRLGTGRQLDSRIREGVGKSYGSDFSEVRIHTDAKAHSLTTQFNARAFTVGKDIVLASNQYRPGTIAGDALIAHELAHVSQQTAGSGKAVTGNYHALESDADRSASRALSSMWLGAKNNARSIVRNTPPALRSGLRLQKCSSSSLSFGDQRVPDYLGAESLATLETIKDRFEAANLLQNTLVYGPLVNIFAGAASPGRGSAVGVGAGAASHPYEAQARAVAAVPSILRNRVIQDIQLLLVMHGNSLNDQERAYWNGILQRFESPGGLTSEE